MAHMSRSSQRKWRALPSRERMWYCIGERTENISRKMISNCREMLRRLDLIDFGGEGTRVAGTRFMKTGRQVDNQPQQTDLIANCA